MPINWVDVPDPKNPPVGAPTLSAANLAKLAVVADVGTAGTATGDALRAASGTYTGARTWTAAQRVNSFFGVNTDGTARQPFTSQQAISATAAGTTDKIAHAFNSTITGDLTASSGSNPSFAWGLAAFTITGPNPGDGKGGALSNLIETDVQTPAGTTISTVQGLVAQAAFFGPNAGATVTQMESMRVAAPVRKDGATAGTATSAVGLFVEAVDPSAVGASSGFSLFVNGGLTRIQGDRLDVPGTVVAPLGSLSLAADFSATSKLTLQNAANGGNVTLALGAPSGLLNMTDSAGSTLFYVDANDFFLRDGLPLVLGTTNGTKIGTATSQKVGFHGATPTAQLTGTPAAATDLTTALALVNDLRAKLITKGLVA